MLLTICLLATTIPFSTQAALPTIDATFEGVTISNVSLNGGSDSVSVGPGGTFEVSLDYYIEASGNPTAIHQIQIGLNPGLPQDCAYDGQASASGSAVLQLLAPEESGTYDLIFDRGGWFSCADALDDWWFGHDAPEQVMGTVTVTGTSTAADTQPASLRLHSNVPNPFNPQTTIAFDIPKPALVSLRVFDLFGRLVRVLVDGEVVNEGRNERMWNGRDENGMKVAAGVYFYRLDAGEYSETKRMALVK